MVLARSTDYRPFHPGRELARADQVMLHRLRLCYRTLQELGNDFLGRQCDHYDVVVHRPLVHYLLSCPATARLRQQPIEGPQDEGAKPPSCSGGVR